MFTPGYYGWYPSSMVSPWYIWFVALGYKELDILKYQDGSWDIIQYYNTPIIPSLTKWQVALGNMKNIELSFSFCRKYANQLDIEQKEFWDRENTATKECEDEHAALQKNKLDSVEIATKAITKNPALMDRIAKNGIQEMDLGYIAKNVPKSEYTKPTIKGATTNVLPRTSLAPK